MRGQSAEGRGQKTATHATVDEPPILKTWPRLYAAVLLALGVEVILFYVLTRAFA